MTGVHLACIWHMALVEIMGNFPRPETKQTMPSVPGLLCVCFVSIPKRIDGDLLFDLVYARVTDVGFICRLQLQN